MEVKEELCFAKSLRFLRVGEWVFRRFGKVLGELSWIAGGFLVYRCYRYRFLYLVCFVR